MSSSTTSSVELQAWEYGKTNNVEGVQTLYKTVSGHYRQFVLDMCVMGSVEGKSKDTGTWALANGACYLWTIQQPRDDTEYIKAYGYSKNLSMLKGPGEVTKGTFKQD